ncbi:MAG: hypothetical protein E7252_10310 [Lachnospira sp.]|nr:hypothetical protein [Lachnospira sp.]
MAKKDKGDAEAKKQKYVHREDAEWLTEEICKEYREKAKLLGSNGGQDTGTWRALRMELQELCDITELEAVNILRGMNIRDYVNKYDILSGKKKAKEEGNNGKTDEIMNQIAELESALETEMMLQKDSD